MNFNNLYKEKPSVFSLILLNLPILNPSLKMEGLLKPFEMI